MLNPRTLPIETLGELPPGRRVMHGAIWRLSTDYRTLGDLSALSFAELLASPGVGAAAAQKIETALAGLSVLLRDGDPEFLRRAPALEEPAPAPDPKQTRATCGRALLLLGKRMLNDGASVIAIAAQVELDPDNSRKQLRMYSGNGRRSGAAEVARIAAPILVAGPTKTKRRKGRRAGAGPASEPETENVVPVVFGAGLTIPK